MAKIKDSRVKFLVDEFDLEPAEANALLQKIKEKSGLVMTIQEFETWMKDKANYKWAYDQGELEGKEEEEEAAPPTTTPAATTNKVGVAVLAKTEGMTGAQKAIYDELIAAREAKDKDLQKKIRRRLRKSGFYLSGKAKSTKPAATSPAPTKPAAAEAEDEDEDDD